MPLARFLGDTKGSKSIRINREVLIYASGRADALGELHKCFSHAFQFIKKFFLQGHCKMHVCARVKLAKSVFLNLFSATGLE